MSLKKVLFIVVTHWSASAVCGIINFSLEALNNVGDPALFTLLLNIVLDITILISFITTYIYFYITVRRLKSLEARDAGQAPESGLDFLIKKFKVPCYIVISYLCFNLTCTIMYTVSSNVHDTKLVGALFTYGHVPMIFGLVSDACIYTFANRNVHKLLCSTCKSRSTQVSNIATNVAV